MYFMILLDSVYHNIIQLCFRFGIQ